MLNLPYTLHLGDCLEVLKTLPDSSVDSIVTDPPYGLSKAPDMAEVMRHWLAGDDYVHKGGGFMGKSWDSFVPGPSVWKECLRVLKPGGHLLSFFGSRTYDLGTLAIRLAGFDIRDQVMWIYSSGFPKSHNLSGDHDGWGTALKPAHEPIVVARKPLSGTVADNVLAHGTGALNIDGCRVGDESGRWPANLIHDGSDEVVAKFPDSKGQQGDVRGTEKSRTGGEGTNCYGEYGRVASAKRGDVGSAARFFYCAKASRKDRNAGLTDPGPQFQHGNTLRKVENTETRGNNHPTVKPTDLMAYLCRLVTPPGGTVLDPFMGSGSTGKAAMREGFQFIGIEREDEYLAIAEARIKHENEVVHREPVAREGRSMDMFADE